MKKSSVYLSLLKLSGKDIQSIVQKNQYNLEFSEYNHLAGKIILNRLTFERQINFDVHAIFRSTFKRYTAIQGINTIMNII